MVHVAYEFLQTPETAFQTVHYKPGQAVVNTYMDKHTQDQYSDNGRNYSSSEQLRKNCVPYFLK